jgi:hypothetical protein
MASFLRPTTEVWAARKHPWWSSGPFLVPSRGNRPLRRQTWPGERAVAVVA